jgi:hypothetical protein
MRIVQDIFVTTLNRPGGIFEIENANSIWGSQGSTGLRNYLLSRESRRTFFPRTRCAGNSFFDQSISIAYCSPSDPFTLLGPFSGPILLYGGRC